MGKQSRDIYPEELLKHSAQTRTGESMPNCGKGWICTHEKNIKDCLVKADFYNLRNA